MMSKKTFLAIVLGEYNEDSETRKAYHLGHFFGFSPYEDNKTTYTIWDKLLQFFLFLPTFLGNTIGLFVKFPFYYISKIITKCSDYLSQKATDFFDELVGENDMYSEETHNLWLALKFIVVGALLLITYAARLGLHLIKAILFPEMAYREARKHHWILGALSLAFTALVYLGLCFVPFVGVPVLIGILGPSITHLIVHAIAPLIKPIVSELVLAIRVVLGLVLTYATQKWFRKEFIKKPIPKVPEALKAHHYDVKPIPKVGELKSQPIPFITSRNVGAIPFLGNFKGLHEDTERYREIARQLVRKQSPIICLQEAFSPLCTSIIRNELRRHGYEFIQDAGFGNFSGLMICVKTKSKENSAVLTPYKILEKKSEAFDKDYAHCPDEILGHKGAKGVKIQISENEFVTLINTHFMSRTSDVEKDAAIEDSLPLLTEWAKEAPKESSLQHRGTFYVGDFNLKYKNGLTLEENAADNKTANTRGIIQGLELANGKNKQDIETKSPMLAMRKMQITHKAQYIVPDNVNEVKATSLKKCAVAELQKENKEQASDAWKTATETTSSFKLSKLKRTKKTVHQKDEGVVDALWFFPPAQLRGKDIQISTKIGDPKNSVTLRADRSKSLSSDHMELDVFVNFNPAPAA